MSRLKKQLSKVVMAIHFSYVLKGDIEDDDNILLFIVLKIPFIRHIYVLDETDGEVENRYDILTLGYTFLSLYTLLLIPLFLINLSYLFLDNRLSGIDGFLVYLLLLVLFIARDVITNIHKNVRHIIKKE